MISMERAVFLDRDGTIIEDIGYINDCSKIIFLPGVTESIKLLNESGFKVIVVTNQAGVARGYFTEETANEINHCVWHMLADKGAFIDKIYYCPHHIEGTVDEYKKDCYCRKPNPGMIEKAAYEFDIDLSNSFLIGDKSSDIEAGLRVGCKTILLAYENYGGEENEPELMAHYVAKDLYEAAKWLLDFSGRKQSGFTKLNC